MQEDYYGHFPFLFGPLVVIFSLKVLFVRSSGFGLMSLTPFLNSHSSEPTLELHAGLHQESGGYITTQSVLTQNEIPEEGRSRKIQPAFGVLSTQTLVEFYNPFMS